MREQPDRSRGREKGKPRLSIDGKPFAPLCDCLMTFEGPGFHKPGCARWEAILRWAGRDIEADAVASARREVG